jgi:septum formation protein
MLGIEHVVDPADLDEQVIPGESPEQSAVRLAQEKAIAVGERHPGERVLAADTLVVVDDEVLGKPASPTEAESMLAKLQGREHRVVTAVALATDGDVEARYDVTRVRFRQLDRDLIRAYVATGESLDKAGAYGVQGYGAVLVERIEGDFFSVMGLPLRLVVELLESAGIPYRFTL